MIQFKSKKIFLDLETVAEQLRSARQAKKLKLKDIARELNINYKYLRALEKGEYNKLPAGVYGKNFLREYAIYLGLNYSELAKIFDEEKNISQPAKRQNIFSKRVIKKRSFLVVPKIAKNILILVVVIICLIYLGVYLEKIISPPEIYIIEPKDNFITNDKFIFVSGLTEPEAQITINGEFILSNNDGSFTKRVDLKTGLNTIVIIAKKKYGREEIVKRQILVND